MVTHKYQEDNGEEYGNVENMLVYKVGGEYGCGDQDQDDKMGTTASYGMTAKIRNDEDWKIPFKAPQRSEVGTEEEEDKEGDGRTSKEEDLMMGGAGSADVTALSEDVRMGVEPPVDYSRTIPETYYTVNICHPYGNKQTPIALCFSL